ncbi:hypothetical protein [Tardiphaga sp. 42S5]|uniref:hypothetical protein n=1 Tax=Tardiphaga sp. 42S5 TaxID=1404799 RepID=UPI002A5A3D00|nr:hypothetical protein [Tardiphaga sp. 42S5]WPO39447.1 hypothetical protein SFY93_18000 [Tardiphaga sp. 42S5]
MTILKDTFKAWIDKQPPGPNKLIVVGKIEVNTGGWKATLKPAEPQGINPDILILQLATIEPTGNVIQVISTIDARYEQSPSARDYTDVTIMHGATSFTIPVTTAS